MYRTCTYIENTATNISFLEASMQTIMDLLQDPIKLFRHCHSPVATHHGAVILILEVNAGGKNKEMSICE